MLTFKLKRSNLIAILFTISSSIHAKELPQETFETQAQRVERALINNEAVSVEVLSDSLQSKYKSENDKPWTILKELAAKADGGVKWDIKDEKILRLADNHGRTMAHELASSYETGWQIDNPNILKLADDEGITVAHELAQNNAYSKQKNDCATQEKYKSSNFEGICPPKIKPWGSNDLNILSLTDHKGNTVAHDLAEVHQNEWVTQDPAVLMLKNQKGLSVAHILAENPVKDWDTDNVTILKLTDNAGISVIHTIASNAIHSHNTETTHWKHNDKELLSLFDGSGQSVAHVLAYSAHFSLDWATDDPEVLKLKAVRGADRFGNVHEGGSFVAHTLASSKKWQTDNLEILKLTNEEGETVAHNLAFYNPNWLPKDPEVLLWKDSNGSTVAHLLAKWSSAWTTDDKTILKLTDDFGDTVAHFLAYSKRWKTSDPEILSLKNADGKTVASILKVKVTPPRPSVEKKSTAIIKALKTAQAVIPVTVSAEEVIKKLGRTCLSKPQLPQKCVLDVYNELGDPTEDIEKGYVRVIHGATKDGLIVAQQFYPDGMPRTNQVAATELATNSLGVEPYNGWLYIYQPTGDGGFYILTERFIKKGEDGKSVLRDVSGKKVF